jgi:hypothetical protein
LDGLERPSWRPDISDGAVVPLCNMPVEAVVIVLLIRLVLPDDVTNTGWNVRAALAGGTE